MKELVSETYGVLVYQEQVMESAQIIAGYTLGGADILRRAMGKKIKEVMDAQKQVFIEGAEKTNNISKKAAEEIFGILEKFAQYGFNKSHSAAYAMLSYRTAYLKANYPTEFMAALLSSELGNADKVSHFVDEAEAMGIEVLGPHINESRENFTPIVNPDDKDKLGSIRFGLAAMKGVGDSAAVKILEERDANGLFKDFKEFAERVDGKAANRRVMECLIKTGAFDYSKIDRQHLLNSLENILSEVADLQKDRETGQGNLFDMLMDEPNADKASSNHGASDYLTNTPKMPTAEKLQYEKEILGFYVSGHPMNAYAGLDDKINSLKGDEDLKKYDRESFRLCGVINNINKRLTKKDNRPWAFFTLSTRKNNYHINVFPDAYENYFSSLEDGATVSIEGEIRYDSEREEIRFNGNRVSDLNRMLSTLIDSVHFFVDSDTEKLIDFSKTLSEFLQNNEGPTKIKLGVQVSGKQYLCADLASSLSCKMNPEVFQKLRKHEAVQGTIVTTKALAPPEKPRWAKPQKASA